MSDPSFVPLTLGNTADDDGQVLGSLVETASAPPTPQVEPIVTPDLPPPPVPTRLLSVRQIVYPSWASPTLLLPEDMRRKHLHISVLSPTTVATDGVLLRSDPGSGTAVLVHDHSVSLDHHTGALFAIALGTDPVEVNVWSVTE